MTQIDVQRLIRQELAKRIQRNPRYSLRAFAKACGISHSVLSLVLTGKRPLSKKAAAKLSDFLGLPPQEREALILSRDQAKGGPQTTDFQQLSLDTFTVISDWYHYAILSLLEIEGSTFEARPISRALGISETEAHLAIERLQRVGLVERKADGRWKQAGKPLKVENSISTSATRRFHRSLLERAIEAMETVPAEERDYSSMTFAMDPTLVPYAKKKIQAFRRELVADLEKRGNPGKVFNLTLQVFPVSSVTAGA